MSPVAHAVTGEPLGPLRLYLIEIWPDNKFIKEDGIKKGEIFLFLGYLERRILYIVSRPPIPDNHDSRS